MSAQPQPLDAVMDQMERNHWTAIEATRSRLAEVPQPGPTVSRDDLGQLPAPATPGVAEKNLVAKYGRTPTPEVERTVVPEPER
jgi:hypothetical protein